MSSGSGGLVLRRSVAAAGGHPQRAPLFGLFVSPALAEVNALWPVVETAERAGIDLVTIQDHPYNPGFLDTWTLLVTIAARTERVRVMSNVASLPLRPPAMLAKAAATLQHVSGGRLELGLGAGAYWDGIESLGERRLTPAQAVEALEEALDVIRLMLGATRDGSGHPVSFDGRWYRLNDAIPGPHIERPVPIWLGAMGPRMLRLTGARADGWSVSRPYVGSDRLAAMQQAIDEGSAELRTAGQGIVVGSAPAWAALLADTYERLGMDTLVFAPAGGDQVEQMRRFSEDVVPRARDAMKEDATR